MVFEWRFIVMLIISKDAPMSVSNIGHNISCWNARRVSITSVKKYSILSLNNCHTSSFTCKASYGTYSTFRISLRVSTKQPRLFQLVAPSCKKSPPDHCQWTPPRAKWNHTKSQHFNRLTSSSSCLILLFPSIKYKKQLSFSWDSEHLHL